jgi:hypothetical protein
MPKRSIIVAPLVYGEDYEYMTTYPAGWWRCTRYTNTHKNAQGEHIVKRCMNINRTDWHLCSWCGLRQEERRKTQRPSSYEGATRGKAREFGKRSRRHRIKT